VYGIVSVTVDPSKLQSILDQLEAGNPLKSENLEILVAGLATKQVIMATGKSAIALGTSADNATITSGDRNIVIPKEIAEAIQAKIGGNIDLHSGDRTVVNNYFFNLSADATEKNNRSLQQLHILLEEVSPEIVQQAYQKSLPFDANLWGIREEARIFNSQQLSKFVGDLIGNELIPQEIRDKLNQTFPQWSGFNPVESIKNSGSEPYLSIVIRLSSIPNRFLVNAWLIPDSTVKDRSKRFRPLDLDESSKGITCGLEEVPALLDKFLDQSLKYLKGQDELTIEIFLPMNCLCTDVDRWMIADLYDEIPVGTRYHTIVRSSDRLEERYLARRMKPWQNNWDRITKSGHLNPNCDDFETLDRFTDCNWKRVVNNLSQKLGLKLTCGLESEHKLDLFRAILTAATPFAIWVRCDLPDLDLAAELDALIAESHLLGLSAAVMRKRQQADEEERSEQHLGAHLAMLWEDPGRLTPDAMEWLLTPGQ
jgi:vWA-MoxR associated protein C-terminal domain